MIKSRRSWWWLYVEKDRRSQLLSASCLYDPLGKLNTSSSSPDKPELKENGLQYSYFNGQIMTITGKLG